MLTTELARRAAEVDWYHSIALTDGFVTLGEMTPEHHERIAVAIPQDLSGKSVLDIGAWDGYYSFLAERRGAARVLAIDSLKFRPNQSINGFNLAKEVLHSKVEYKVVPVEDLDKLDEVFNVVFFFGIYYHVRNPLDVLDKVCAKVSELLVVEGDALDLPSLMMMPNFADPDMFGGWRFTRPLLHTLLSERGFSSIIEAPFLPVSLQRPPGFKEVVLTGRSLLRCWR